MKMRKALSICSSGSSCRHMFAPSVRMKKPGSHVRLQLFLKILLVFLLAGKASCNQTSAAPTSPLPPLTTTAETSVVVEYILNVTVDVPGQNKGESDIKQWLVNVFQNTLESCVSPNSKTTTAIPNYTQITTATTSVTLSNSTTTATSTLESNNTTTATTSVTPGNNTTTATTSVTPGNNTTTATTSVTPSNNTTAATTSVTPSNNTTTAATSVTPSNNTTTATTSVTLSNNTTTATTSVTLSNNTTTATTSVTLSNNTTTATTSVTLSNNTTTATTLVTPSNNTTAATTSVTPSNNTTTAATSVTPSNNTTTAATSVTLSNNTTTATTSVTLSNNTTTATTSVRPSNNPTTTTTLVRPSNNPTTATTSVRPSNNPTTTTTSVRPSNNPTTTTTARSLSTTAATTQRNSLTTTLTHSISTFTVSTKNQAGNNRKRRAVRDTGISVRQIREISNDTTAGLFQSTDISCATNASIITTVCTVTLTLAQTVPACCILRTLCAASNGSSDIHVMGNKVYLDQPQNVCNSNLQMENSCTYMGPANNTCAESEAAYVAGQTNTCGPVTNSCSCCSNTDAYYTFQISIQNPAPGLNTTNVSSLILGTLQRAINCTSNVSCPLSIVAYEYKDTSVICGDKVTNHQNCSVILRFFNEVPICLVAVAVMYAFQSQAQITYDGLVTKAAICGNSDFSSNSLASQFTWVNLMSASSCMEIQQSNNVTCQNGETVVVQMGEPCNMSSTTSSVNTTAKPNNTTGSGSQDAAESQANALLDLTSDMSKLNSSQVDQLVSQLESLLSGPNVSLALGNTSVRIVSNLLSASPATLAHSSNRIIRIVDTVGLKLVLGNASETLLSPSVALSVKPADGSNFQETFFSISDPSNVQISGNRRLRRSVTTGSSIPQGSITLPSSLTQNLSSSEQQLATRVQFNFYQKSTVFQDKSLGTRKLNSGILGASVANLSVTGLKDNVVISLRNTEPIPANYVATCVFWDFTLHNSSGGWNPNGCVLQNSTDNETICGCSHLTSFAVLLDLSRQSLTSPLQATILNFITYIGCGISAIFLSVTLLTYLTFEKLRRDIPSKILVHLCTALLLLNLVFLVDAWLALYTEAVGLCISTAWFLHYFLLVSFTWMGLEAVHMYNAIVKVFNNHMSHYMLKFSLVGWGIPIIIVIIVIAVNKNNYGLVSYGKFTDGQSDEFCWLTNDIAFYVAVVAYFCVIFLFNVIMFIVVLVQLCRIKRQNPHNVQHRNMLDNVRSVAGITVLLGLTWGFAFFAWGPLNLPFMYLFAIFNSLQGFFIFVFYCALKENVKKQWRAYLCCGRMRVSENSDWSRTATQKTTKKSSVTKLRSLHSLKSSQSNSSSSSTSFLVTDSSEQISGISSPFEDRGITADEDASMDVILNEINRRQRNQQAP